MDRLYNILQERIESFQRLWRSFHTVLQDSEEDIQSLKSSLDLLEHSILENLRNSMMHAAEYFSGNMS